jgi:hypothetical protein
VPAFPSISALLITLAAGLLAGGPPVLGQVRPAVGRPTIDRPPDDAGLAAAGIRKVVGRHLSLYTDLPRDPEIDRLPVLFDQAVPQWAEYFGINPALQRRGGNVRSPQPPLITWQIRGYLIKDRAKFDALGLMPPAGLDHFVNGYSVSGQFWLYDQPTPYYRRHLMLHEGTHAFMSSFLGGMGPVWYMEGTAELFATHRLDEAAGKLTLRIMPRNRDEVPMLGRIALIENSRGKERLLGLPAVMQIDNRGLVENEAYAWCWSLCVFLDSHPRYRERFRNLRNHVADREFNETMRKHFQEDWNELLLEWKAFIASLDHGYDFMRMAIDVQVGEALRRGTRRGATVQVDHGWQSSRVRLEAGQEYRISASGRFQIAEEVDNGKLTPWPSEAGGVTIEYYNGKPLGLLLGAIVPDRISTSNTGNPSIDDRANSSNDPDDLSNPISIGVEKTIRPTTSGTLYLRVNDSPGKLHDNRGSLNVAIESVFSAAR